MAVFHTAERRNPQTGLPERDEGLAGRTAAIDSAASRDVDAEPSAFARRLWRAAGRFGFAAAKRQVVVADARSGSSDSGLFECGRLLALRFCRSETTEAYMETRGTSRRTVVRWRCTRTGTACSG